jgi:hypothetical protein
MRKFILWMNSLNTLTTDILGLAVNAGVIWFNHQVSPMPVWLVVLAWVYLPVFVIALAMRCRGREVA